MHHRLIRWLPAAVAPVVLAGAIALPLTAAAAPSLDAKTPKEVLQLVAKAKSIGGFSGEITQTSDLGLPALPSTGAGTDSQTASVLELVTGNHKARVSVDGATKSRVAILDPMGERDVVRDGRSVWLWDSKAGTATHVVATGTAAHPGSTPTAVPTPGEVADELLTKADPTTSITLGDPVQIAGHDAYQLVATPRTAETTVGSIRIAVDAVTGLPLQVTVSARGTDSPAFQTGFTTLDYSVPAASTFRFTPPSDAKVETKTLAAPKAGERSKQHASPSAAQRPTVLGSGWSAVIEVPAADVPKDLSSNPTFTRLTTGADGGRVLSTSLVNVLLTADGRVFAGAVPVSRLSAAAAAG